MPLGSAFLRKVPVEIILPEHARVSLVGENERVGEHLVVDDRIRARNIMVLDESDGLCRPVVQECPLLLFKVTQAESAVVAQVAQTITEREVKGGNRIVGPCICFVEPILNCAVFVPTFSDAEGLEDLAVPQSA